MTQNLLLKREALHTRIVSLLESLKATYTTDEEENERNILAKIGELMDELEE